MPINVTNGPTGAPLKAVVFGPSGVGKTSLIKTEPGETVFIDTEGSTTNYQVKRIETTNFAEVNEAIEYLLNESHPYTNVALDTISAWEDFAEQEILKREKKDRMGAFNFGKGSVYLREELDHFLSNLDRLARKGLNLLILAHSTVTRIQPPEIIEGYDKNVFALDKVAAQTLKRWAQTVLFINYKIRVIETDERKTRGIGGEQRMIYTRPNASYDAKNRHDLPAEIPFEKDIWPEALNALFHAPVLTDTDEKLFEAFCEAVAGINREHLKAYLVERGEIAPGDNSRAISPEFQKLIIDNPEGFREAVENFAKTAQPATV
jgi:GTPase SAR1 family protein